MTVCRLLMRRLLPHTHPSNIASRVIAEPRLVRKIGYSAFKGPIHPVRGTAHRCVAIQLFSKEDVAGSCSKDSLFTRWERSFTELAESAANETGVEKEKHAQGRPAAPAKQQDGRNIGLLRSEVGRPSKKKPTKARPYAFEEDVHGIQAADIPLKILRVLITLRSAGHEGYLVGGAVRDLVLRSRPKDFDIVTSATPRQVKKLFPFGMLIGKRHPIVKFRLSGLDVEVSSFITGSRIPLPDDAAGLLSKGSDRRHEGKRKRELETVSSGHEPTEPAISAGGGGRSWSEARMLNARDRDFTVNAMMYDPFSRVVFDYTDGIQHCRQRRLEFIGDARASLSIDPARALRAVRLAARVGLDIDRSLLRLLSECRELLLSLSLSRMQMEMDAIMSGGAAANSMKLLYTLDLLEYIFPPVQNILKDIEYPKWKTKPQYKKNGLFRALDLMDQAATSGAPLPIFVWPAVLIGYVAQAQSTNKELALKSLDGEQEGKSRSSGQSSPAKSSTKVKALWKTAMAEMAKGKLNPIPKAHGPKVLALLDQATKQGGAEKAVEHECLECGARIRLLPGEHIPDCQCGRPIPLKLRSPGQKASNIASQIVSRALQQCQ